MDFKITQTTLNALGDLIEKQEEWTDTYGHALDDGGQSEREALKELWDLYRHLEALISQ